MTPPYYCIWSLCDPQQYCCGDNVCCGNATFNSLLLTFVIIGTMIVMALCCTCFYCSSRRACIPFFKQYFNISYILMSTQREKKGCATGSEESMLEGCIVEVEKTKATI